MPGFQRHQKVEALLPPRCDEQLCSQVRRRWKTLCENWSMPFTRHMMMIAVVGMRRKASGHLGA